MGGEKYSNKSLFKSVYCVFSSTAATSTAASTSTGALPHSVEVHAIVCTSRAAPIRAAISTSSAASATTAAAAPINKAIKGDLPISVSCASASSASSSSSCHYIYTKYYTLQSIIYREYYE